MVGSTTSCSHPGINFFFYHSESLGLHVDPSKDTTYHAIIVANANYEGRTVDAKQCIKDREQLRMALLKTGWECGMF